MTVLNDVKKGRAAYFCLKKMLLSRYLLGSKTPTSKFSVRWGGGLPVNARLVKANNQWGMNKNLLIKVSLY
ncbi:hypothetical protein [Bacillus thuringiensis]|jgi:hypothetical protein|uniref:hypothetical protein n=1 Tax=Bacillus thuringiensis TaxID=1428 RepID=UPI000C9DB958|nr:hypothetical protein [Bacillus thuringiensis]MEB9415327.1 hypothetical protein [Bacillus cereus]MEB9444760.1 hypothetical protein [Bacillus cereus]